MLGPNLTQERFRLATYYLTDLAFQASGDEPLGWGEFCDRTTQNNSVLSPKPIHVAINQ
jgi:hypothetical protein